MDQAIVVNHAEGVIRSDVAAGSGDELCGCLRTVTGTVRYLESLHSIATTSLKKFQLSFALFYTIKYRTLIKPTSFFFNQLILPLQNQDVYFFVNQKGKLEARRADN